MRIISPRAVQTVAARAGQRHRLAWALRGLEGPALARTPARSACLCFFTLGGIGVGKVMEDELVCQPDGWG